MNDSVHTNLLIHETSPYLLQHAHNPVKWHAWNDAALAKARASDRPILLSIGYSACHWCHVMAHESFEDAETAALMNRLYVNIKVDREERPDLDRIYQLAHQLLTQRSGGWPLTLFLTPDDLTPFFAGTYFPRTPRYGMPGFKEVLTRVADFYREHPSELRQQNTALKDAFQSIASQVAVPDANLTDAPLRAAYRALAQNFDARFGGFGPAPKFPHAFALQFLLQRSFDPKVDAESSTHSREMLDVTLTRMAEGGIFDQLGGGFFRYSTDAEWTIPHFEKMLYDNAILLTTYSQAAAATSNPTYAAAARATAGWIMRDMQGDHGGYYSSMDADSEGREGKYYVWERDAIRALLTAEELAVCEPHYGLDKPPNFETFWHLRVRRTIPEIAAATHESESGVSAQLQSARAKLLAARQRRVSPGCDDKVLTAWNGLMIQGMAAAGRLSNDLACIESAERAAQFIHHALWRDARLLASWRDGQAKLPAYLDDYAFLLNGLIELLQTRWDSKLFAWARRLADSLLGHFHDSENGGFWFTAHDQNTPLQRSKAFADDSLPAGNAIAASALLRLGHWCAEPRYIEAAEGTLKSAYAGISRYPDAHAAMLLALADALQAPTMIVLRGQPDKLRTWSAALDQHFDPRRTVLAIPADAPDLSGLLAQCAPRGDICAYLCRGTQCSLPITDLEELTGR